MPIYEYRCGRCERVFEKLVSVSSGHGPAPCPECAGPSDKMLSIVAARRSEGSAGGGGGCCGGGGGGCACAAR